MRELLAEEAVSPELSTLALQRKFHGTKKYELNPSNSYKELTEVVVRYQQERKSEDLQQILKLTEKLIYKVMQSYGIMRFPPHVVEDLFSDCQTEVLLKRIETFDPEKANFTTYLTWWLKSFLNYKNDYHERRSDLYNACSINEGRIKHDGRPDEGALQDRLTTMSQSTMARAKREFSSMLS